MATPTRGTAHGVSNYDLSKGTTKYNTFGKHTHSLLTSTVRTTYRSPAEISFRIKLFTHRLPTNGKSNAFGGICQRCMTTTETTEHLFTCQATHSKLVELLQLTNRRLAFLLTTHKEETRIATEDLITTIFGTPQEMLAQPICRGLITTALTRRLVDQGCTNTKARRLVTLTADAWLHAFYTIIWLNRNKRNHRVRDPLSAQRTPNWQRQLTTKENLPERRSRMETAMRDIISRVTHNPPITRETILQIPPSRKRRRPPAIAARAANAAGVAPTAPNILDRAGLTL